VIVFFIGVAYTFSYVFRAVGYSYRYSRIDDVALLPNTAMRIRRGLSRGLFIGILIEIADVAYEGLFWRWLIPKGLFCRWLIRVLAEK
jgi:hypothetical protein